MSRLPFWLPPTNPSLPKPIPKLIIKGFEGPPEVRQALVGRFAEALKQFYIKAAHNHSLGIVGLSSSTRETPDYKLTYDNVNGQENVTIEVAASVVSEELRKQDIPWDWAVVDFEMPAQFYTYMDGTGTDVSYALMVARMVFPEPREEDGGKNHPDAEWGAAFKDLSLSGFRNASAEPENPILQWVFSPFHNQVGGSLETSSDQVEIASLLVDLRRWPTWEQISIEIYANMSHINDDTQEIPGEQIGWAVFQFPSTPATPSCLFYDNHGCVPNPEIITATVGPIPDSDPDPFAGQDYNIYPVIPDLLGLPQLGGEYRPDSTFPPTAGVGNWAVNPALAISVTQSVGSSLRRPGPTLSTSIWHFLEHQNHWYYVPLFDSGTGVSVPVYIENSADIKAAMFRGTPDWAWSSRLTEFDNEAVSWGQWYIEPNYPNRFGLGRIQQSVQIDSVDNSSGAEPLTGLTLIGTLHFSPKSGGISFEPPQ